MVTRSLCLLFLLALSAAAQTPRIPPPESVNRNGLVGRWLWDGGVVGAVARNWMTGFPGGIIGGGTHSRLTHRSGLRLGSGKYVSVGKPESIGSKTAVQWVYYHSLGDSYLITNYSTASDGFSVFLNADGTLGISWHGAVNVVRSSHALTAGKWCHVGAVYTASAGIIFLDGTPIKSGSLGTEVTTTNTTRLGGRWVTPNAGSTREPDATLSDVRIYNRALSAAEIAAIYRGVQ
jgi:hypothetical protein